jgi:hypothetical protein
LPTCKGSAVASVLEPTRSAKKAVGIHLDWVRLTLGASEVGVTLSMMLAGWLAPLRRHAAARSDENIEYMVTRGGLKRRERGTARAGLAVTVDSRQPNLCPGCGEQSKSRHSTYWRALGKRALAADIRRRAEAAVAERQQRQKAQQQEEHRRQTDHMRSLHHDEMHGFRDNEDEAIARHAHEIETINEWEQQALEKLGVRRESLVSRTVTLLKGNDHYKREAEAIVERWESERIVQHRDLEALKERQFLAAQQARLRHAQERKGIFELHRMEPAASGAGVPA